MRDSLQAAFRLLPWLSPKQTLALLIKTGLETARWSAYSRTGSSGVAESSQRLRQQSLQLINTVGFALREAGLSVLRFSCPLLRPSQPPGAGLLHVPGFSVSLRSRSSGVGVSLSSLFPVSVISTGSPHSMPFLVWRAEHTSQSYVFIFSGTCG